MASQNALPGQDISIGVTLTRRSKHFRRSYAPRYPKNKEEMWWLIVGNLHVDMQGYHILTLAPSMMLTRQSQSLLFLQVVAESCMRCVVSRSNNAPMRNSSSKRHRNSACMSSSCTWSRIRSSDLIRWTLLYWMCPQTDVARQLPHLLRAQVQ